MGGEPFERNDIERKDRSVVHPHGSPSKYRAESSEYKECGKGVQGRWLVVFRWTVG